MKKSTELPKSPTKFDIVGSMFVTDEHVVTISEISKLANYQRVTLRVKVLHEGKVQTVKSNLCKQEYIIGDATGSCKIRDDCGIISPEQSVKLSGLLVRTFNGKKYVCIPRSNFEVSVLEDIGDVDKSALESVQEQKMSDVCIVGVKYFERYSACYSCNGKVIPKSVTVGHCGRCGSSQRLERCKEHLSARIDVECAEGGKNVQNLSVFSPTLEEICGKEPASIDALLEAAPFDIFHSDTNVILSVSRK